MDPGYVSRQLQRRAEDLHLSLLLEYGETPERERTVELPGHEFPDTPEDVFPWASVALVTDPDHQRVLLLRHEGHQYGWEPPGGKGEPEESPAFTAVRETREETGLTPEIEDLLLVEYLQFDYGEAETAPVVQAVFAGVAEGDPRVPESEPDIPTARWFDRDELPEDAQFREQILDLLE